MFIVPNNPIGRVDPDGRLDDDYFNQYGKYLGSDNSSTDKVRIIKQETWDQVKDNISWTADDGSTIISSGAGNAISQDGSQSNMSDKAQLNIYGHYNETGVPLIAMKRGIGEYLDDGINIGMTTFGSGKNVNRIEVRLDGNKNAKVFDHANEIKNIFSHEGQHVKDIRNGVIYSREQAEQRAILTQMSHPTFLRTRPIFQNTVMKYGIRFGMKFD